MLRLLPALFLLLPLGLARADEGEGEPAPDSPPTVETQVSGEVPVDLRGIWLIAATGKVQKSEKLYRNSLELCSVQGKDGKIDVQPVLRELPEDIENQLEQANKKFQPWAPSAEQVAQVGQALDGLKPVDPMRYVRHVTVIQAPSASAEAPHDLRDYIADSKFALQTEHVYRPRPLKEGETGLQLMGEKTLYGVQKIEPTQLAGRHVRTILAAGFVPVPVTTEGDFTMYRLRGPEQMPEPASGGGGFFSNLFRGCGRSQ
ncbi:MAG TPA: hypothetical protein VKA21_15220 [Candidatus Binatia bacterium]|nr:hypothetical protein [Candidatus Binatia bacterium]